MDKGTGLIHSVKTSAANEHDLTPPADLPRGEKQVVYTDAGYLGIEKREEMVSKSIGFGVAIWPCKHQVLANNQDGRLLDLLDAAKVMIGAKVEHPFRVI